MSRRLGDVRCWLRLRPMGIMNWRGGQRGHCAVWGYATPLGALRGSRRLHRQQRGSRRSAGAPDITETFTAITGPYATAQPQRLVRERRDD
jgi:hypothetical protein